MFYDNKVMNSETLIPVWKAAHNLLTSESTDKISLPNICKVLNKKVNSDHHHSRKRFSLKTSANFIGGATRLYKMGVDNLYKDALKLDNAILQRKRRLDNTIEEQEETSKSITESSTATQPEESSRTIEEQREQPKITTEHSSVTYSEESSTATKGQTTQSELRAESLSAGHLEDAINNESTSKMASQSLERSKGSTAKSNGMRLTEGSVDGRSGTRRESSPMELTDAAIIGQSKTLSTEGGIGQVESQGSMDRNSMNLETGGSSARPTEEEGFGVQAGFEERSPGNGFDKNLPFGCTIVYDNYNSRTPSKLIISSLNVVLREL